MTSAQPGQEQRMVTVEEFCARFATRMLERAGPTFDDGSSIAEYAAEIAPTYYEDFCVDGPKPLTETPEECADADMSYWGED